MKEISFDVIIEIPKGSRNKYEFDNKYNSIRLNRVLYSTIVYPTDYGFIPKTLSMDGDPLDALVLLTEKTVPNCLIKVKPVGIFYMIDENIQDEKIICVPLSDPNYNFINNINDIPKHKIKEIEHFFSVYKYLENKKVKTGSWDDKKKAINIYQESSIKYQESLKI